jgi:hypothetical protein
VKWRFAKAVLRLLHEPRERERLQREAETQVRRRARPELSVTRYYEAFAAARAHLEKASTLEPLVTMRQMRSLARWTGLHLTLAGVGLLRPPTTVNRNHTRQPNWDGAKLKPLSFDDALAARPGA